MSFRVAIVLCFLFLVLGVCQAKLGGNNKREEKLQLVPRHRHLIGLDFLGSDPSGTLSRCQGDCDGDGDCAGSLECMQRDGGEPVPGCSGNDGSRTDYCYDPNDAGGSPSPPVPSPVAQPTGPPPSPTGGGLSLHFLGVNPPPSALPLGECEGDCDNDNQCGSGLYCYQRSGGDPIPGCSGSDGSNTDYCVPGGGGGSPTGSPPTGPPPSSGNKFRLRLYWEQGYYWQETNDETFWCMECRHGRCDTGDKLFITFCNGGNQYFSFVPLSGDKVLIQLEGGKYCLERANKDIYVRNCEENENKQWWEPSSKYDFSDHKFEITPSTAGNLCITQRHHPKDGEEVEIETCSGAASSDTSYWEKY